MGSGASKGVESSSNQEEQAFYAERPVRVSLAVMMLLRKANDHVYDKQHWSSSLSWQAFCD